MTADRILNCIGSVDDKYIEEAKPRKNSTKNTIWKHITIAACLCILLIGCFAIPKIITDENVPSNDQTEINNDDPQINNTPGNDQEPSSIIEPNDSHDVDIQENIEVKYIDGLQVLSISECYSDMGFEVYDAYDISELVRNNPWNESVEFEHLPVFKNNHQLDNLHRIKNPDTTKMTEIMTDVCSRLGLNTETLEINDYTDGKDPRHGIEIEVVTHDVKIEVFADYKTRITFEPGIEIPPEYNFNYHTSFEEAQEVADYLQENYNNLIGFNSVQQNISGGDYNIYLKQNYDISFYENSEDLLHKIINYNFKSIKFCPNDKGELWMIWIDNKDISEKVSDYPIINIEEAIDLLENGIYYAPIPSGEFPGKEYIAKVELIYNTDDYNEYYMPYYKFYIELPIDEKYYTANNSDGLKSYGAFYVPAIDKKWINMEYVSYSD